MPQAIDDDVAEIEGLAVGKIHFEPAAFGKAGADAGPIALLPLAVLLEIFDHAAAEICRQRIAVSADVVRE